MDKQQLGWQGAIRAGEGKAWHGDHLRYPGVDDGRKERLIVPKIEGDERGMIVEHALIRNPVSGRVKRVVISEIPAHQHPLAKHNLRKAYATFAAECENVADMGWYLNSQALARTAQKDGRGNKLSAYKDRPRKQRKATQIVEKPKSNLPTYTCSLAPRIYLHGAGCGCFPCLVKLGKTKKREH